MADSAHRADDHNGPLRVLLMDPTEKGALPLYTAMIAQALSYAGAKPCVLANTHYVDPGVEATWPILRDLRAGHWPPPTGTAPPNAPQIIMRWLLVALQTWRTTASRRPDILHIQHPIHPRFDTWLVQQLKGLTTLVWTAHDVLPHDRSSKSAIRAASIYKACDAVLVHSEPAAAQVQEIAGFKPIIIRHPVRSIQNRPSRLEARKRLGIAEGARLVSAVGFIRAYKGYGLIADALRHSHRSDLRILVLGQLVDSSEARAIDAIRRDPRAIVRLEYASEAEIIDAIAASDAVLLPHAIASDSGSLHMARALGVPVFASDAPQLASVVTQTAAGVVLPRVPEVWGAALDGRLPDPPPAPPSPHEIGVEHLSAYHIASRRRQAKLENHHSRDQ